jgi:uncharacterized protein YcbK (DUF882 family)
LNRFLRDHRSGEIHEYDPRVFDLLYHPATALGNSGRAIDVVCGFRTPWSNEFLRTHGPGMARHSLDMQAMAIDIRVPGISTARLRDAAWRCIVAVAATTPPRISCTSMWGASGARSWHWIYG